MGNKLLTSRSSSTDEENNQGTYEMHPFRAGYDLMSTTTSAHRKSVECWEFFFISNDISNNGSQLKNPDISGAHYTLRIQYNYTRTQCEDYARDVRIL